MINQLRRTAPFIDFGFGILAKQAATNEKVTVWLSTLYNPEAYNIGILADAGAEITRISDYEYLVSSGTPGIYNISLGINYSNRKISLQSNTITLTVT